jgi:hypothetical protein
MSEPPIRHLNQVELGRRWSMSHRTLERWRWEGHGPRYLKVGGRVLYRLADIEAFEAEHFCGSQRRVSPYRLSRVLR